MWRFIITFYSLLGLSHDRFGEYKGYRRTIGGRWGKWEIKVGRWKPFTIWLPLLCVDYPPPAFGATHTEPLEAEDYVH